MIRLFLANRRRIFIFEGNFDELIASIGFSFFCLNASILVIIGVFSNYCWLSIHSINRTIDQVNLINYFGIYISRLKCFKYFGKKVTHSSISYLSFQSWNNFMALSMWHILQVFHIDNNVAAFRIFIQYP